ncbi:MAG: RNA polymerase sigma factor SigY [Melioribacteraceae bacterium]|nr:MAG: RNA polymerase sigma factor SigY [Melioribacteraceae bacterium]
MISENSVIRKVQRGNIKAYKKLYDLHFLKLYRFLSQFSKDHDLVEDWVQNAFIKAYENIHHFGFRSKFSTWLFSIAMNEMRSFYRTDNRRSEYHVEKDASELGDEVIPDFIWQHDMNIYLSELDDEKRAIFILFEVEGYSHKEIADIIGLPENLCRSKLHRTKKILKQKWLENEKA